MDLPTDSGTSVYEEMKTRDSSTANAFNTHVEFDKKKSLKNVF